jgi:hypothetical protein
MVQVAQTLYISEALGLRAAIDASRRKRRFVMNALMR